MPADWARRGPRHDTRVLLGGLRAHWRCSTTGGANWGLGPRAVPNKNCGAVCCGRLSAGANSLGEHAEAPRLSAGAKSLAEHAEGEDALRFTCKYFFAAFSRISDCLFAVSIALYRLSVKDSSGRAFAAARKVRRSGLGTFMVTVPPKLASGSISTFLPLPEIACKAWGCS